CPCSPPSAPPAPRCFPRKPNPQRSSVSPSRSSLLFFLCGCASEPATPAVVSPPPAEPAVSSPEPAPVPPAAPPPLPVATPDPCAGKPDDMACVPAGSFSRGMDDDPHRCTQMGQPNDFKSAAQPAAVI